MLKQLGIPSTITGKEEEIMRAEKLVLPGVGAFDHGMSMLKERGLVDPLQRRVIEQRIPILGICLGAHLMTKGSEEGALPGLGWLSSTTVRFQANRLPPRFPIPHMGWNEVEAQPSSRLFAGLAKDQRYYFVHSFHFESADPMEVAAIAEYGYRFAAALERGHIAAVQFHPEKSHRFGLRLLERFAKEF